MRVRTKDCYVCNDAKEVLYRCRYDDLKDWVFLCGKCLTDVKTRFEETYQYGGTWKSKKRLKGADLIVQSFLVFARFAVPLIFFIFSTSLHAQTSSFICEKWQNVGTHSENRSFIAKQTNDGFTIKNQYGTDLTIWFLGKHNRNVNLYAGRHTNNKTTEIYAVLFVPSSVWVEWDLEIHRFDLVSPKKVKSHCFRQ